MVAVATAFTPAVSQQRHHLLAEQVISTRPAIVLINGCTHRQHCMLCSTQDCPPLPTNSEQHRSEVLPQSRASPSSTPSHTFSFSSTPLARTCLYLLLPNIAFEVPCQPSSIPKEPTSDSHHGKHNHPPPSQLPLRCPAPRPPRTVPAATAFAVAILHSKTTRKAQTCLSIAYGISNATVPSFRSVTHAGLRILPLVCSHLRASLSRPSHLGRAVVP